MSNVATKQRPGTELCEGLTNVYGRTPEASIGNLCVLSTAAVGSDGPAGGFRVLAPDETHHRVEVGDYQVKSVGRDNPSPTGRAMAGGVGDEAIRYVSSTQTREAAIERLLRYCERNGGPDEQAAAARIRRTLAETEDE